MSWNFAVQTYMVENCLPVVPFDINCIASLVCGKTHMQWLQCLTSVSCMKVKNDRYIKKQSINIRDCHVFVVRSYVLDQYLVDVSHKVRKEEKSFCEIIWWYSISLHQRQGKTKNKKQKHKFIMRSFLVKLAFTKLMINKRPDGIS